MNGYTTFAAGLYDTWTTNDYNTSGSNLIDPNHTTDASGGTSLYTYLYGTSEGRNFLNAISVLSVSVPAGYTDGTTGSPKVYMSWTGNSVYPMGSGLFIIGTGRRGSFRGSIAKITATITLRSGWSLTLPVERSSSQISLVTSSGATASSSAGVSYHNGYYYIYRGVTGSTEVYSGSVTFTNSTSSTATISYVIGRPKNPGTADCGDSDSYFNNLGSGTTPPNIMMFGNGAAPPPQPTTHTVTYHYYRQGNYVSVALSQNAVHYPTDADNQFTANSTTFTKTGWNVAEGTSVAADMDVYAVYRADRQFSDTYINIYGWYPYGGSEQYRKLALTLSESFSKSNIRADNVSSTSASFQSVTINSLTRNSNQTWKVNYTANVPSGYSVTLTPNNNISSNYHFLTFYGADKTYHEVTDWNPTFPYTISSTGTKDIKSHWSNKTIRRYRNSGRFNGAENYSQGSGWYRDVDPQKYDNGVWRDTNLYKYIFNLGWVNQDVDLQINR